MHSGRAVRAWFFWILVCKSRMEEPIVGREGRGQERGAAGEGPVRNTLCPEAAARPQPRPHCPHLESRPVRSRGCPGSLRGCSAGDGDAA